MSNYIYSFNYNHHHNELCKLESRQIFGAEEKNKMLFSDIKINPSNSAFIKKRFDIILSSENYTTLIEKIKKNNICIDGFKVEYLVLDQDSTNYKERLNKLRDVGYSIEGEPDYRTPTIIYSICHYEDVWYFGTLMKQDTNWKKHKKKPCSFSNSLGIYIAKTLVNITSKCNKNNTLLDACCGVGTVLLEACYSGFNIEGCDINPKAYEHTKHNLEYYNYTANTYCLDIKEHHKKYDGAIIDLPYNLYSYSDDTITKKIIESTALLTSRIVIVSISNIESVIKKSNLKVVDFCTVEKRGRSSFSRNIWVCEKMMNTV